MYRKQHSRIWQPDRITVVLALIVATLVVAVTVLTVAFLLTGGLPT